MWGVVVLAVGLASVLLLWRIVRSRQVLLPNIIAIVFIVIAMLIAPSRFESTALPGVKPPVTPLAISPTGQPPRTDGIFTRMLKQVGQRRAGFRLYDARESDIAGDVRLNTPSDVLKFLPRAIVIGFLAPFPRMWIERGSYGLAGRLLSGAETLVMYFLYLAAGVCVWRNRRRSEMWLLFLVAALGTIALGLVVVNAGALYRLRYVFWIMFIIMAADTLVHFTILRTSATKS
jgi:hypothetical protein